MALAQQDSKKEPWLSYVENIIHSLEGDKMEPVRQVYESGAEREVLNLSYSLIPTSPLRRLAALYNKGAVKYSPHNWEKGIPFSEMYNHLMEHLQKWREGDKSEDNLAAVAWGVFGLMFFEDNQRVDLDDITTGQKLKASDYLPKDTYFTGPL